MDRPIAAMGTREAGRKVDALEGLLFLSEHSRIVNAAAWSTL
jgi:hypothetical protein